MSEGQCQVCDCCGDFHIGCVEFPDTESKSQYDKKPADCHHCLAIKHDLPGNRKDIARCEFHKQLKDYRAAELARVQAESEERESKRSKEKTDTASDSDAADAQGFSSKKPKLEASSAQGSSEKQEKAEVVVISSDEESAPGRGVIDLISDDEGPSGSAAPVLRVARVARAASDPPAENRAEARAAGARAAEARAAEAEGAEEAAGVLPSAPPRRFPLSIRRKLA